MLFVMGFLVGNVTGATVGFVLCALLAANRRDDDGTEGKNH